MPSVIQRLPNFGQERSCLNILSVGSGTGDIVVEILKLVKEELQRRQGYHQIKIYNRAIEPNEYSFYVYQAAVKNLDNQQIDFDLRRQTFEEHKAKGAEEPEERVKFDVIHFIHSIYYMDLEEALNHCVENELSTNGSLLCIVERSDLICWVLEKQRFPDWHGKPERDPCPERFETAEKIFQILRECGWKHEVYNHEFLIDVTDVFDEESREGNLLLDFLTHTANFRETGDQQLVKETLALIKDLSTVNDGKHFGERKESLIVIYK